METIGTSCILCVHKHRITSPFMMMSMDAYTMIMIIIIMPHMKLGGILTSEHPTMESYPDYVGSRRCELSGDSRLHMWVVCREVLVQTGGHPNDAFNDRSLIMSCMWFHSLNPIVRSLTEYFSKYSSLVLLLIQVKAKTPCTTYNDITSKDQDTCIR